jgi:uncharacterized membrane protein (GlpM family)
MLEVVSTGAFCYSVTAVTAVLCYDNSRRCFMYGVLTRRLPFETDSVHQTMLEVVSMDDLLFLLLLCYVITSAAALYVVLTGRLPFETDSVHQTMLEGVSMTVTYLLFLLLLWYVITTVATRCFAALCMKC